MNYDDGADSISDTTLANVITGTGNNTMLAITDDVSVASQDKNGQEINAEQQYVTSVNASNISHTFTVIDSNSHRILNIPVGPSTTINTIIEFTTAGTFHWQCYVPCGSGSTGWDGAMSTPGWMEGNVIVA